MTKGRVAVWIVLLAFGITAAAAAFMLVPRLFDDSNEATTAEEPVPTPATPRIKARLFYLSDDGLRLVAREREIPFGEGTLEQARRLVAAQLEPPAAPLVSAIPSGTRLRALYLTTTGDAYVDLSKEVVSGHSGGALDEILTVYSIVDVLTTNLPAVTGVQILVDGHEVDTLVGHVDLRRPLAKNIAWIDVPERAAPPGASSPSGQPPTGGTGSGGR